MDSDIEKAGRQLRKNDASNFEQYQEATPHKPQLYGHLPPITKTIKVRGTRHAGHCWRSKDELISDVLQWTPAYGQAKAGRRARTYIQQLCEDTECSPEDLPGAMNDREVWRERFEDILAGCSSWWWWWIYVKIICYNSCYIFVNITFPYPLDYHCASPPRSLFFVPWPRYVCAKDYKHRSRVIKSITT